MKYLLRLLFKSLNSFEDDISFSIRLEREYELLKKIKDYDEEVFIDVVISACVGICMGAH